MPSTYTTSLSLTLPATGELSGTWGTTVNTGITSLVDDSVAGTTSITMTAADYTLTTTQGATNEARRMFLTLTGTPGAARNVIVPAVSKLYFVFNNTTGGFAQTVKTSAGAGISVPNGARVVLYCDGTNVVNAINTVTFSTPLAVASGGTGLTSGTSGGVLFYSAAGTLASSAALAANALVVGGGAGVAPSTITTGTGVTTALGVNTGSAGAFVVNGGALGTPSSGTVTNLTGTASININGTVGATTPNTGAFTSVVSTSASGVLNRAAATQDGIALVGRAGGTSSWSVSLTPTTLSASRTVTFPDSNTTIPIATQQLTFSGPTAARTITFPDANITVARTDAANTFSGTQTFGGSVVPATNTVDSVGYTGTPVNSQSVAYQLVASDAGKTIFHPASDNNARTFTIPANGTVAFPVGTTITFINKINTVTIAITTDTLTLAGAGTTGSRTLAANGIATAVKITSTEWIISGNGLT